MEGVKLLVDRHKLSGYGPLPSIPVANKGLGWNPESSHPDDWHPGGEKNRPSCRQFNGHWGHVDGFDSTSQRYLLRVFTGQPGAKPKIATWKTGSFLFLWIKKLGTYIYIYMYIYVHIDRCIVMYMCTNLYILFDFWDILY